MPYIRVGEPIRLYVLKAQLCKTLRLRCRMTGRDTEEVNLHATATGHLVVLDSVGQVYDLPGYRVSAVRFVHPYPAAAMYLSEPLLNGQVPVPAWADERNWDKVGLMAPDDYERVVANLTRLQDGAYYFSAELSESRCRGNIQFCPYEKSGPTTSAVLS